ncbi:MAG: DUF1266 domain-containing protein [Myxococcota bacterium]
MGWYTLAAVLACATLLTVVPVRVVVAAAVAGLVAVIWAIVRWRQPSAAERQRMRAEADAASPFKAWVHGALFIVSRDIDYGHLPPAAARQMLIHWWEVHGPHEMRDTLRELEHPGRPDNAWDLLRFIVVIRLGAAAHYIADDDAWERIHPVAARLQASYVGWPEMAQAYVVARRQWKGIAIDGSEDDAGMARILDNIANLREGAWSTLSWDAMLDPPEPERQP